MLKTIILAFACATGQVAESAECVPVPGYYKVRGTDAKGDAYSAVATVVKFNHVYVVTWVTGTGPMVRGTGLLIGERLSVGWSPPGSSVAGCTVYTVAAGGQRLTGRWTAGTGQIGDEVMTFFAPFEEEE